MKESRVMWLLRVIRGALVGVLVVASVPDGQFWLTILLIVGIAVILSITDYIATER